MEETFLPSNMPDTLTFPFAAITADRLPSAHTTFTTPSHGFSMPFASATSALSFEVKRFRVPETV